MDTDVDSTAASASPTSSQACLDGTSEEDAEAVKKSQPVLDEALDFCRLAQDFWQKGELENAVEALDQAYALIIRVDTYNHPKLIQQKEDLRFMISRRILEIYASRNIVVNGNHNAIPLVMNQHIQSEINRFTGREKRFFLNSYRRSGRYRPQIVAALKEAGLPLELSWLPLIESGFIVRALSPARALGLWQFIPSTGYKFGLKRNYYIDERLDPIKSTRAAIAYLKELHQIFGDWSTVLAAYNCGEGRVLRVIRNQNVNYLDNFWDLYERLPLETARYVPRFLATLHILANPKKYGMDDIQVDPPLEYETVTVVRQMNLRDVARSIDVPERTIKDLNPELRYGLLPADNYALRVPPNKGEMLLAGLEKIPVSKSGQGGYIRHRVRRGETLSTIAQRYHTSVNKIVRANNIRRKNMIVAGKVLKIPKAGSVAAPPPPPASSVSSGQSFVHVVKSGDNLWKIARRYNTNTKKIYALNHLRSTTLSIGQRLKIPGQGTSTPSTGKALHSYQVKRGDSPYSIARAHNIPLRRFLQVNSLTPRSKIYPGQTLLVE